MKSYPNIAIAYMVGYWFPDRDFKPWGALWVRALDRYYYCDPRVGGSGARSIVRIAIDEDHQERFRLALHSLPLCPSG